MRFIEKLNTPVAVFLVLAVFLILDGFLFYRYQQSLRSTESGTNYAQTEEVTQETVTQETTTAPEEQNRVQVAVGVVNTPVGLSIREDGNLVHDQVTNPGFYEEFEAEESITIAAADGGAVQVEVDGEELTLLGEGGEGVTRTFTDE